MATNTMVALQTQVLASTASTVTFSSIPQGYTDLVIVAVPIAGSGGADLSIRFNSDSGSNYSHTILWGTGSSAGSNRYSNQTYILCDYYGSVGSNPSTRFINVMNYSNTTTYKTVLARAGNAGSGTDAIVGTWRNTAAITTIDIFQGPTFGVGSTFTLYGIAAA
jgi:hypothetical protein